MQFFKIEAATGNLFVTPLKTTFICLNFIIKFTKFESWDILIKHNKAQSLLPLLDVSCYK